MPVGVPEQCQSPETSSHNRNNTTPAYAPMILRAVAKSGRWKIPFSSQRVFTYFLKKHPGTISNLAAPDLSMAPGIGWHEHLTLLAS